MTDPETAEVHSWIDSHCHLDHTGEGMEAVLTCLADARSVGVEQMIDIGTDLATSVAAIERARELRGVWATVGVHPHDAEGGIDGIEALLGDPHVVAVGECGLDYHYDHSPREIQRSAFAAQISMAHAHDLALVIHTREAWDDTFTVLDAEGVPERTVFHCFTGGPDEALAGVERGIHVSFSGIVTFKSAADVRAAAASVPLDRILVETDSPYLAPVPHRGRPNRPEMVPLVGEAIAVERNVPVAEIAAATAANTTRVFQLGSPDERPLR